MLTEADLNLFIDTIVEHHGSKDEAYLALRHQLHTTDPAQSKLMEDVWHNLKAAHDILRPQTSFKDQGDLS